MSDVLKNRKRITFHFCCKTHGKETRHFQTASDKFSLSSSKLLWVALKGTVYVQTSVGETTQLVLPLKPGVHSFAHAELRCLPRYLWRYPDLEVFTAVSTSPSLPAMQWKKNSCRRNAHAKSKTEDKKGHKQSFLHRTCGLIPVRNLPDTKPPAPGEGSYGSKQGRDFPEGISGGLRPSNSI